MMTEQEKFQQIPGEGREMAQMFLRFQLPELEGAPEQGKWVRLRAEGTTCANGEPYHACFKLGDKEKLMIVLYGGGVSVDEYTAAHPNSIIKTGQPSFYCEDIFLTADLGRVYGIASDDAGNPFRDWSVLLMPYGTGDFHCGANDFAFQDEQGETHIVCHRGYTNLCAIVNAMKEYLPSPAKLLVTGFSAGAFGTALLTDAIMDLFPTCADVTCCVDSACLFYQNWDKVAREIWGAPREIAERLTTEDITGDSLIALHKKRENVKIGFGCSVRDEALAMFQNYFDKGRMQHEEGCGDVFENNLRAMLRRLVREIPNLSLYLHDLPLQGENPHRLTAHCIIVGAPVFTYKREGETVAAWLYALTEGRMHKIGEGFLEG